jgi:hypothetical protein
LCSKQNGGKWEMDMVRKMEMGRKIEIAREIEVGDR